MVRSSFERQLSEVEEDMLVMAGVPVLGVLRPEGSKRPVFRRLLQIGPAPPGRPLLSAPGGRP